MKKTLLLCCALLALAAPAAFAGLDITAVACNSNTSPVSSPTFAFDCAFVNNPNGGAMVPQTLFCCFQLPATEDSVVAVDSALDLIVGAASLPAWWQFDGCNTQAGGVPSVYADLIRSTTLCVGATAFWGPTGSAGPTGFASNFNSHGPNTGHFFESISRPTPVKLNVTTNYFNFNLNFLADNATESGGTCAGCNTPATLVYNSALILNSRAASRIGPESNPTQVSGPGLKSNCVNFGNGVPNGCSVTPAKNKTWGQLKSLYR